MSFIKKLPIPVCGLALGFAILGNLLASYGVLYRYLCGAISLTILILFTLKTISNPSLLKKELENPVAFSILPTYTMAFILLSAYIKPFASLVATLLWAFSLILHFIITICFFKTFVLKFNIKTLFPSWFIPFVGFVVGSVTAPALGQKGIGQILFYLGFILYLILLPIVLYRVIKIKQIPEPALPTLTIICAPISLCLAGYLSTFDAKNKILVTFMFILCIISYLFALYTMTKTLRIQFYPSYSAFTFPLVISAVALKMSSAYFAQGSNYLLSLLSRCSFSIAIGAVLYVFIKYCIFIFTKEHKKPN